jgi:uncharacterized protein YkwD
MIKVQATDGLFPRHLLCRHCMIFERRESVTKQKHMCLNIGILTLLVTLLAACTTGTNPTTNQGQSFTTQASTAIATPTRVQATPTAKPAPTKTPKPKAKHTPTATPTPSSATNYSDSLAAAQAVFLLINQERASKGLAAFKWSKALVKSAHLHNILMLRDNTLSHQLPGEAGLLTRIQAQGISGSFFAENIGYGWGSAAKAANGLNVSMFAEKPPDDGHRLNILSKATIIGIDVIVNTHNSQVWLTEDFAKTT